MFQTFIDKIVKFNLAHYIIISIALILCTFIFYPDRFPSLIAMVNRMFIATVFVKVAFALQPKVDDDYYSMVWACSLIGAGMSI